MPAMPGSSCPSANGFSGTSVRRLAAVGNREEPAGAAGLVGEWAGELDLDAGRAPASRPNRGVERVAEQRAMQLPVRVSVPASREHGLDAPGLDPEAVVVGLAERTGATVFLLASAKRDAPTATRIDPVVDRGRDLVPLGFGLQGGGGAAPARARSHEPWGCPNPAACWQRGFTGPSRVQFARATLRPTRPVTPASHRDTIP